jgi:hypothetical protein
VAHTPFNMARLGSVQGPTSVSGGGQLPTQVSGLGSESLPGNQAGWWDKMVADVGEMGMDDYRNLLGSMFQGGSEGGGGGGAGYPPMMQAPGLGQVTPVRGDMLAMLSRPSQPGSGGLF